MCNITMKRVVYCILIVATNYNYVHFRVRNLYTRVVGLYIYLHLPPQKVCCKISYFEKLTLITVVIGGFFPYIISPMVVLDTEFYHVMDCISFTHTTHIPFWRN